MFGFIKSYLNKRVDLAKLELMEATSKLMSVLVYFIFIFIAFLMFFFMLSLSIGIMVGEWLGNRGLGMLLFSLIYLVILVVFLLKGKNIRKYLMEKIIELQLTVEEKKDESKNLNEE